MANFIKIGLAVAEIWRFNGFSNWRPSAILDLCNSNFFTVAAVKRPILHHRTNFSKNWFSSCGDIAIFVIFKMAAAAMLVFEKFEILTVCRLQRANLRHRTKFYQNRPNGCGDMAI